MKATPHLLAIAALFLLGGCATPRQTYTKQHPELSPQHRSILAAGQIPSGDAVAGMSREEVRITMGAEPATFDRIGDEDAWVYVRKKAVARKSFDESDRPSNFRSNSSFSSTEQTDFAPRIDVDVKTTIFFQGNRATHALITEERP
ncbi:MAG: hypothetical protein QOE70_3861 [Chthoniobacter sp.]|jgi:outer membrane protein assembly factor BamE (lipoprotein component of BamABCDE complex)|nr:hypothetical protein [Chthoniobacter sp.]